MAKRNGRKISKKKYVGLVRVTNSEGKRVWKYRGEEYKTLREVSNKFPQG